MSLKMEKIVVIGGGGHAKVVISILKKNRDHDVIGYVDPVNNGQILGVPYIGDDSVLSNLAKQEVTQAVIGIGHAADPSLRMSLADKTLEMGFSFPAIISPDAIVNEDIELGKGTVVMDGAVINASLRTGSFVIINTGSLVDHDCQIGNYSHVGPGAVLCGGVNIGDGVLIGAGAIVCPGKIITDNCVIGAGTVVTGDCKQKGTYVGVPMRKIK